MFGVEQRQSHQETSEKILEGDRLRVAAELHMPSGDEILASLVEWSPRESPYFWAKFINKEWARGRDDLWYQIVAVNFPAKPKKDAGRKTGDSLVLRTLQGVGLFIAALDGVTHVGEPWDGIELLREKYLNEDEGSDRLVGKMLSKPEKIEEVMRKTHKRALVRRIGIAAIPELNSPAKSFWEHVNTALRGLYAGLGINPDSVKPSQLPGLIGASCLISRGSLPAAFSFDTKAMRAKFLRMATYEVCAVGDALGITIDPGFWCSLLTYNSNALHDEDTLDAIKRVMTEEGCDAPGAVKRLENSGYYVTSYDNKVNAGGGVCVCNGGRDFVKAFRVMPWTVGSARWAHGLGVCTDGLVSPLSGGRPARQLLEELLGKMYRGEDLGSLGPALAHLQENTFDPLNPGRERPFDDAAAVFVMMQEPVGSERLRLVER